MDPIHRNDDQLFDALRDVVSHDLPGTPPGDPLAELAETYAIGPALGSGGQGTVYRATPRADGGTPVALKLFRQAMDSRQHLRLARVAELVAGLDHPAILPILDHGTAAGRPFTVQPLVQGVPLDVWSRALPNDRATVDRAAGDRRLAVAERLARAVAHAHGRGVLHRDIKPSNVLVDRDDRPFLLDFGIARGTAPDLPVTASEEFVGTLAYAAPERLTTPACPGDVRHDVYSLGAVLYEVFAGRPAFSTDLPLAELLQRMQAGAPPLTSVRSDLATVIARAIHPNPGRRYGTALELAEELERLRNGQPVRARLDGALYRLWRRGRRHPVAVTGIALGTLALGALTFAWDRDRDASSAERDAAVVREALRRAVEPTDASLAAPARLAAAAAHLQSVDAQPMLRADLYEELGHLWLDLGHPDRGEPHLRHARELLERLPAPNPDRLLRLDVAIGRSLCERRRDEGLPLLATALGQYEDRFGEHAPETARVRVHYAEGLAAVYYNPDPDAARRELAVARRDLTLALGTDHPAVAWTGVLTHNMSKLEAERPQATTAELQSYVQELRQPGSTPRQFSAAAYALAHRLQQEDGDPATIAALRREAASRMQVAGAWRVSDLVRAEAMIRFGEGDAGGAERLARRALALDLEQHSGPDAATDPELTRLVATLHGSGGLDAGTGPEHPMVRGHLWLLDTLGRDQWQLAADMQDGARILASTGDDAAARALLTHAVEVTCQEFGSNCPVRLKSLHLLAGFERGAGDRDGALAHLRELWSIARHLGDRMTSHYEQAGRELLALLEETGGQPDEARTLRAELDDLGEAR